MKRSLRSLGARACAQCTVQRGQSCRINGRLTIRLLMGNPQQMGARSLSSATGETIFKSPLPDCELPEVSLSDYMFSRFDKFGENVAMVDYPSGRSYRYSELQQRARAIGSGLTRLGLSKGDVIAYYGTNNPEFALLLLACSATGITLTTANPAYTAGELSRHMDHSGAKLMVTIEPLIPKAKEALNESGFKDIIVLGSATGCRPFSVLLEDDGSAFPDNVKIDPHKDVLVLPYSSGTTGLPKGVMLNHYSVVSNLVQLKGSVSVSTDDNTFGVLPFFHIYGMAPLMLGSLQDGATMYTVPNFDPESYLTAIQKHKITQLHMVPPIVLFMAKHPVVSKFDLSSVHTVFSAAAPLGEAVSHEFMDRLKVPISQGYGLTETSPVVNLDREPVTVGSVGRLLANTEAKIVDMDTGAVLGRNEVGEICVRGPQNMLGYLNNKAATDDMIKDGWLYTGDVGYVKDNDCFVLSDRLKELIKYKGLQVAPAELENLLLKHPAVQDVAVLGMPDDRAGELPRAYIVKRPGTEIKSAELIQYVESHVADYKRLRGGVEFLEQIPKSPSGKILRRILKDQLTSSQN